MKIRRWSRSLSWTGFAGLGFLPNRAAFDANRGLAGPVNLAEAVDGFDLPDAGLAAADLPAVTLRPVGCTSLFRAALWRVTAAPWLGLDFTRLAW